MISRRAFTRLGVCSLAAASLSAEKQLAALPPEPDRKIGFAVIGLGVIAGHFVRAVQGSQYCRITGLVSGHPDKAKRMAAELGVPFESIYDYGNMDGMASNPSIDAVYVALPNTMHAEYTIRAARAGKHVLCEKPMCTTEEDGRQMIETCRAANVKLMVAYRCQYDPLHLKAQAMLRDGLLGKIQTISGYYGGRPKLGTWRLDPKLSGGGSLFDTGIYALNASRFLTGEEPADFSARVSTPERGDPEFALMEENVTWTVAFPSGILATGMCSYGATMPGMLNVYGASGWLTLNPAFSYEGLHLDAQYKANKTPQGPFTVVNEAGGEVDPIEFTREADHFAECILNGRTPRTPGEEGLKDVGYILRIYRSAGVSL